jgi:type IX secretion system PorP/SprF family membrane protein
LKQFKVKGLDMSKLFRFVTLFISQLALISSINAQDAVFSQYFSSGLYISPCFAGIEPNLNIGVNTRTQWKSVTAPYVTNQLSIIKPFYKYGLTDNNVGGVGLSIFQDKAGDFGYQVLGANLNGAYNLRAGENHTVTFGLQAGVIQKQINPDKLEWGSQFNNYKGFDSSFPPDPIQSSGNLSGSKIMLDLGAGLLYYYKAGRARREKGGSFWLGYSAFHINRPNESLVSGYTSKLPMNNKVIGGFEFTLGSRFNLSPNALVVMQGQDAKAIKGLNNMQINTGMYITYMLAELDDKSDMRPKDLILGGWYRLNDSFIASLGIASNIYTIGFSYDLNQSGLKVVTQGKGAWEVSLKIQVPKKEKVKRYYTPRI